MSLSQVFLEDAGFDWKILGPDVRDVDYVAWQCDQDAYACSGQKCSAQSMLFTHANWVRAGIYDKMAAFASRWVAASILLVHPFFKCMETIISALPHIILKMKRYFCSCTLTSMLTPLSAMMPASKRRLIGRLKAR